MNGLLSTGPWPINRYGIRLNLPIALLTPVLVHSQLPGTVGSIIVILNSMFDEARPRRT